jgi:hypothetical protein
MLADEYMLIFLSLSAHIRLTEYISATLHNFNFSFFNRLQLSADETRNTSTAEALDVGGHAIGHFLLLKPFD